MLRHLRLGGIRRCLSGIDRRTAPACNLEVAPISKPSYILQISSFKSSCGLSTLSKKLIINVAPVSEGCYRYLDTDIHDRAVWNGQSDEPTVGRRAGENRARGQPPFQV
jgi:hypothetical protein